VLTSDKFLYNGTGEEVREFVNVSDAAKISVDCLDEQYKNSKLLIAGIERLKMRDVIDMVKEITCRDVHVAYSEDTYANHYKVTPYNYDLGYSGKIVNNPYVDIGQGIIQMIEEIVRDE
jgi:UDP-glucose 4-epimerase